MPCSGTLPPLQGGNEVYVRFTARALISTGWRGAKYVFTDTVHLIRNIIAIASRLATAELFSFFPAIFLAEIDSLHRCILREIETAGGIEFLCCSAEI